MRLSRLLLVTLLLSFAALPSLRAQTAPSDASPYSVVVPVTDTSGAQRDEAFATALAQVLTRVAGGQDLRSKAGYSDALGNARALVRKFQYQRVGGGLGLDVDFEPGTVRRLVANLGVTSAGVKPPVLLLVQGTDGQLFDQSALAPLAAAAGKRGTNVTYPDASSALDISKVAAADPAALAAINQQYRTGLVLVGKLRAGGADWILISGGQSQRWSDVGTTEDIVLGDAGSAAADRINKQLNVVGASVSDSKLWVSGLHSALDYAGLLALLRADPAVRQVTTVGATGDGVLLEIKAALPLPALIANLAAGGRVLLQNDAHAGADGNVRWLH